MEIFFTILGIVFLALVAYAIYEAYFKKVERQETGKGGSSSPDSAVNVSTPPSLLSEKNLDNAPLRIRNSETDNAPLRIRDNKPSMSKTLPAYPTRSNLNKTTSRVTTRQDREDYLRREREEGFFIEPLLDIANPMNPLSPLHPMNQTVEPYPLEENRPLEGAQPSYVEPVVTPSYNYEPTPTPTPAPVVDTTPSYSPPASTYSPPSNDSGSSYTSSYDSGSSSSSSDSGSSSSFD